MLSGDRTHRIITKMHKMIPYFQRIAIGILIVSFLNITVSADCTLCCVNTRGVLGCDQATCEGTCSQNEGCWFANPSGSVAGCHSCTEISSCTGYTSDACAANKCGVNSPKGCEVDGDACVAVSDAVPAECATITKCEDYTKEQCTTNPCNIKTDCELSGTTCKTITGSAGTDSGADEDTQFIDEIKQGLYQVVMLLYCIVLYIASAVAALAIILTGISYMSSDDDKSRVESRRRLSYAIVGLLIVAMTCPLINVFFTDGKIGIPDASGKKVPCPTCPLVPSLSIGPVDNPSITPGGSGTGSGNLGEKCTSTSACTSDLFCSDDTRTGVTDGTCVERYKKGDACNTLMEISDKNVVCVIGSVCNNKRMCEENTLTGCTNAASCKDPRKYCDKDGICQMRTGKGSTCGAALIKGDDANHMCQEDLFCINGLCAECSRTEDCASKANTYCNEDEGKCLPKVANTIECNANLVRGGNANDMCLSTYCNLKMHTPICDKLP